MDKSSPSPHNRHTFNKILAQLDDPNEAIQHNALHRCNKWLESNNLRWTDIIKISTQDTPTSPPTSPTSSSTTTSTYQHPWVFIKENIGFLLAALAFMFTIVYMFVSSTN